MYLLNFYRAKDVLFYSGCGALYALHENFTKQQSLDLLKIISISRLANTVLMEVIKYPYRGLRPYQVKEQDLQNKYAITGSIVNITAIGLLKAYNFIGTKGLLCLCAFTVIRGLSLFIGEFKKLYPALFEL